MSAAPRNDGGSAFPSEAMKVHPADHARLKDAMGWSNQEAMRALRNQPGMSLRDWFAGQALTGLLASPRAGVAADRIATAAYRIADAMIAEREKDVPL